MRFLILAPLSLLIAACSQNEMQRQFRMERAINEANRLKRQFYITGGEIDRAEFEKLRDSFIAVTKMISAPPGDSAAIADASEPLRVSWQMAGLAYFNLGLLNMQMGNLDSAFDDFQLLIEKYGFKPHQTRTALLMQALARYKQKKYRESVTLYNQVAQYYQRTGAIEPNPDMDALDSPLTAARILRTTAEKKQFECQINRAIDYYWGILIGSQGTPLGDAAIGKLASAFLMGDLADSAVSVLSQVKDPSTGQIPPIVLFNIAGIEQNYLDDYAAAEESYMKFVDLYENHPLAASAQLGIGMALYYEKKYNRARDELTAAEHFKGAGYDAQAEATYYRARSFEKQNDWQRALGEFSYLRANYPISRRGMEAPMYVAGYYQSKGESRLATEAFDDAEEDYRKLMDIYSARSDIVARATWFLARCFRMQKRWEEAVDLLKTLATRYPQTPEGYSAIPLAAEILSSKLNKPKDAAAMIKLFIENYPGVSSVKDMKAYADSLESLLD